MPIFTGGHEKRPNQVQALTTAVTEMAKAMTTPRALSAPAPTTVAIPSSPEKIATLHSNYL